ncbi:hypothetical protein SASPL_104636 [Salvia splendens]|uniref:Uncharacterized protein n=1 Tax=Salvia splendens TaxID=180675 RepID=A0A8X9AA01_SALSN|nr:uncharacterized protein LOC121788451 [Salvia splendens]XP_042043061.1 uncharacterized protein LOC121788451 [Salvia splendens]KAG6433031.1 hypothetical protein SASPL_104636 [Salvia splendens]
MERSEPTLVPEWLKKAGSLNGGSSPSNSDDQTSLKLARNKSFAKSNGNDFGRSFSSDRTTSSYFRRSSSSNGSGHLSSHSSFGKQHDRDWDRNTYDSRDREMSIMRDFRRWDSSDGSGATLLSKYERDGFSRSHSMVSGNNVDTWHKNAITDSSTTVGTKANGLLIKSRPIGGVKKTFFEKDFPSLGSEERTVTPEVGRVTSPSLGSAIFGLPLGSSTIANGEKWTSALAEVPVLVGSNSNVISPVQLAATRSSTVALGSSANLNMAEAVAQAPNRGQTTPSLLVGTQRLEELAIKQSRQLIPVTPSMPKTLAFSSTDKQKNKVVGPVKGDILKASNAGKLHVLKSGSEKNGTAYAMKDSLSPTSSSKLVSSTLAAPSVSGSTATRGSTNNPIHGRKPAFTVLDKRPTSQAQSRNDFFNSVRKKSLENSSSIAGSPTANSSPVVEINTATSPSSSDKSEMEVMCGNTSQGGETSLGVSLGGDNLPEIRGDMKENVGTCDVQKHISNGMKHPSLDLIFPEEEEAALLRSLGWEENAEGDEGGLTEEEINAFREDITKYINSKPSFKILKEAPPKIFPFDSHIGGMSTGLSSSDAKLES